MRLRVRELKPYSWGEAVIYVAVLAMVIIAGIELTHLLNGWVPKLGLGPINVACRLGIAMIGWATIAWLRRARTQRATYRAVRELGIDVCTQCGYWLRSLGIDVNRCPEYGTPRVTSNGLEIQQQAPLQSETTGKG